ncbi:hypothetical protein FNV43_RR15451 [Rhamnella rubrinervis]|uniref:Uncharacterized protein n=1 Tax=Rhamnella rubrinervis TaxID=2594499 RepID=A0A8K0GU96_9ROSA|nr:hypothetical protein FNV43_RR15451 [Rhamnella rubrinervis]
MLIICFSIALTASIVVLWNKKQNATEASQIQNIDGSLTPRGSPESLFINADRELENLPQQSLVQATNVHYGQRPDLKRSSIGVLVSGTKGLRHDVAVICSSELAENLDFESISFTW